MATIADPPDVAAPPAETDEAPVGAADSTAPSTAPPDSKDGTTAARDTPVAAASKSSAAADAPPNAGTRGRVDVIFNPISGTGDPDTDAALIEQHLGVSFGTVTIRRTTPDVGAAELARAALDDGADVVVASGGDGTVGEVAAVLVDAEKGSGLVGGSGPDGDGGRRVRLGVIPRGTANAFAAALGIPSSVTAAADLIATGVSRPIDAVWMNGRLMILLGGVGLEAAVVSKADRGLKRRLGPLAYVLSGIHAIREQRTFRVRLELIDVEDTSDSGVVVTVPTARVENLVVKGLTVANVAPPTSVLAQGLGAVRPDDGLVEVVAYTAGGTLHSISALFRLFMSGVLLRRTRLAGVRAVRARGVRVVCEPRQLVVIDGEEVGEADMVVTQGETRRQFDVLAPPAVEMKRARRRLARTLGKVARNVRGLLLFGVTVAILQSVRPLFGEDEDEERVGVASL